MDCYLERMDNMLGSFTSNIKHLLALIDTGQFNTEKTQKKSLPCDGNKIMCKNQILFMFILPTQFQDTLYK